MKTVLNYICATLVAASTLGLNASEQSVAEKSASPEFARMKSLVGTWQGKTDMGQGPVELTVSYRLLAGGSVLEERVFAGTPNEMITMYYEKDGKLALTHYCMFGNRPGMVLASSDSKTLKFEFDKNCGINPQKESHMNALTIAFVDKETIQSTCKAVIDGKAVEGAPTTMKRIKS